MLGASVLAREDGRSPFPLDFPERPGTGRAISTASWGKERGMRAMEIVPW